jgi:hypothetical protein
MDPGRGCPAQIFGRGQHVHSSHRSEVEEVGPSHKVPREHAEHTDKTGTGRAEGVGEIVTASKILGLVSAASGAIGTLLLFFGSFAYEQPPYYTKPAMIAALIKRNKRRQLLQRTGLGLIMLSFVLAGFSVLS